MDTYEKKYKEALGRAKKIIGYYKTHNRSDEASIEDLESIFPELAESEDECVEKIKKDIISYLNNRQITSIAESNATERWLSWLEKYKPISFTSLEDTKVKMSLMQYISELNQDVVHLHPGIETCNEWIAWLEKQGSEPNWCHHKVDLSNCSEEYRKAYYDGWNNCNQQHSQCKSEGNDVVKCLINGMKFYYEDNEEATWGTEKFPMKIKDILAWLEKQGEQKQTDEDMKEALRTEYEKGRADAIAEMQKEWSEEDEVRLQACLDTLQAKSLMGKVDTIMTEWLKSLKNRVQPIHEYSDTERQEMFIKSQRPHFGDQPMSRWKH